MPSPGGTPIPDLPPLGTWSGLRLNCCPECGRDVAEEYDLSRLGGTATGIPSNCCCRNDTGVPGGCRRRLFETREEHEAITILAPELVGNPEMAAAVEDLKHEIVVYTLAIALVERDIEVVDGLAKTYSLELRATAIVKWFLVAYAVALLFCIVVAMSVK